MTYLSKKMHSIYKQFKKIKDVLQDIVGNEINEKGNNVKRISVLKLSDIEVIALALGQNG